MKDKRELNTHENPFDAEAFEIRALAIGVLILSGLVLAGIAAFLYWLS